MFQFPGYDTVLSMVVPVLTWETEWKPQTVSLSLVTIPCESTVLHEHMESVQGSALAVCYLTFKQC